jgi:hypothetical protein
MEFTPEIVTCAANKTLAGTGTQYCATSKFGAKTTAQSE